MNFATTANQGPNTTGKLVAYWLEGWTVRGVDWGGLGDSTGVADWTGMDWKRTVDSGLGWAWTGLGGTPSKYVQLIPEVYKKKQGVTWCPEIMFYWVAH